ncbi:hypothetical protein FB45DRAFT_838238, partial [Roridomyces roridus]
MTSNPLKRARSSSPGAPGRSRQPSPVRDSHYYAEDGNCIIRVENVLFKTHRIFLTRESEVLADMFQLPQGDLRAEGTSDENAIFLPGDTASEFRAFMRYTLASRLETQVDHIPTAAAKAVLDLGHLANKYMMTSWVEWAVSVIQYLCKTSNTGSRALSADVFRSALLLSKKAPQAVDLWKTIPELWKKRLPGSIGMEVRDALDAAEAVGHRAFLVDIYYLILSEKRTCTGLNGSSASLQQQFPYRGLAPIHIQRILAGSWSLTMLWQQLVNKPPEFQLPPNWKCGVHTKCTPLWKQNWRDGMHSSDMDSLNPADIVGRIDCAERRYARLTHWQSDATCCIYIIMTEHNPFARVKKEVKDSLAQRFFGTEGSPLFAPLTA